MSERLNAVTEKLEQLGLVILKDENGKYVTRGNRNIKINGENIKPILAAAVEALPNVTVLNRVNVIDYDVTENRINGAFGIGIENDTFYAIKADAVIIASSRSLQTEQSRFFTPQDVVSSVQYRSRLRNGNPPRSGNDHV